MHGPINISRPKL